MSPRGVGAAGFGMLLAACAAGSPGVPHLADDSTSEAEVPHLEGVIYAPNNGPGDVPAGREVPVSGALVRLLHLRPDPIPDGVHCRRCLERGGWWAAISDAGGRFRLDDIEPGEYWLVIEAGPFRRDARVLIDADTRALRVGPELTELPSVHDPANGAYAPRVALLSGAFDPAGRWLGQLGLGGLDDDGAYLPDPTNDRVDVYFNGGPTDYPYAGHARDLLRDPEQLSRYHVLLVPSSEAARFEDALALASDDDGLRALRDWVAAGGALIATGESSRFTDAPWPGGVELDESQDVPASAYDASRDGWWPSRFPAESGVGLEYDSPHAVAVDMALAAWFREQVGPGHALYHWEPDGRFIGPDPRLVGPYDPTDLPVLGSTAVIERLGTIDAEGMPARVLLEGANGMEDLRRGPLAVTLEPPGCGRVLYSTAPLSPVAPHELTVMERVAFYFLVNTPVCTRPPI